MPRGKRAEDILELRASDEAMVEQTVQSRHRRTRLLTPNRLAHRIEQRSDVKWRLVS